MVMMMMTMTTNNDDDNGDRGKTVPLNGQKENKMLSVVGCDCPGIWPEQNTDIPQYRLPWDFIPNGVEGSKLTDEIEYVSNLMKGDEAHPLQSSTCYFWSCHDRQYRQMLLPCHSDCSSISSSFSLNLTWSCSIVLLMELSGNLSQKHICPGRQQYPLFGSLLHRPGPLFPISSRCGT